MRVAIVHEWLSTYAGSERLLEQELAVFTDADVFCTVDFLPAEQRRFLDAKRVTKSFIQKLPFARRHFRSYLPLMPLAVEQFDLSGYDVVISNSHAVAKGVLTGPDQLHICMCLTPIRYAWDLQRQYLHGSGLDGRLRGWAAKLVLHYLRIWDVRSAHGVDEFIAISRFVARRIAKYYRRDAIVLYPPVDTNAFALRTDKQDFYLAASRMVPYKRMDLIVEAFRRMPDRKLIVIGDGPDARRVRAATGPNVRLLGQVDQATLIDHMQRARAFVFAAEEDFGIVPVEAQACGTPVIALRRGAVTETVIDGRTGLFFDEQTPESIRQAVERFETRAGPFDPHEIRANAELFGNERFRRELAETVERLYVRFTRSRGA